MQAALETERSCSYKYATPIKLYLYDAFICHFLLTQLSLFDSVAAAISQYNDDTWLGWVSVTVIFRSAVNIYLYIFKHHFTI